MGSHLRKGKVIRSLKAELSYLKCFQLHVQPEMPRELQAIMKRDLDMLTGILAHFVHPRLYSKGTLIEAVALPRDCVRVLLSGHVIVFEPINHKAFKSCMKARKEGLV